jgi:hypothetical protein
MVTYWVDHSPSQEVFPKMTLSKSFNEYGVDGVCLLVMRFLDIQGLILSHLWVPL